MQGEQQSSKESKERTNNKNDTNYGFFIIANAQFVCTSLFPNYETVGLDVQWWSEPPHHKLQIYLLLKEGPLMDNGSGEK